MIDHSDVPGYPAKPTRVYQDETRLAPVSMHWAKRKGALDRHTRYRERKRLKRRLEAK